jgi:hypothetical protein
MSWEENNIIPVHLEHEVFDCPFDFVASFRNASFKNVSLFTRGRKNSLCRGIFPLPSSDDEEEGLKPSDFGLNWASSEAIRYLLRAWSIEKRCERGELTAWLTLEFQAERTVASSSSSSTRCDIARCDIARCDIVHEAARFAAIDGADWFLEAYSLAIFRAARTSASLLGFQDAIRIPTTALESIPPPLVSAIQASMHFWLEKK